MIEPAGIIVGATAMLALVGMAHRLFFDPRRVRDESAVRVRDRAVESTVVERVHGGRPDPDRGRVGRVRGRGVEVGADATRTAPVRGQCFLPAVEHVVRFVDWLIHDEDGVAHKIVKSDAGLFSDYLQWCAKFSVVPLPAKTILTLMGRQPNVAKDRPIRKCPKTGRALYHATGSPDRWTRYTIRPPRKIPGTVPVTDVVAAQPVKTKKQRDAEKAARAPQFEMPETIAA